MNFKTTYFLFGLLGVVLVIWHKLAVGNYVADQQGLPPKSYIEHMLASIRRWLDDPSRENTERVRSSLDVTRTRVTPKATKAFAAHHPKCKVQFIEPTAK